MTAMMTKVYVYRFSYVTKHTTPSQGWQPSAVVVLLTGTKAINSVSCIR